MLGKLRGQITPLLRKIGEVLSFLPLTSNQFTFLAVILAVVAAYFLATQQFLWGALFVSIASIWDLLDGSFARAKGDNSLFGNYWDDMVDKLVETCFYFGLAVIFPLHAFLAYSFTMLVSYAKPRVALVIEADNHDWPAIGERIDRLLLVVIGLFAAGLGSYFGFWSPLLIIKIMLTAVIAITGLGFIQRIFYAKQLIEKAKKEGKVLPYLRDKDNRNNH